MLCERLRDVNFQHDRIRAHVKILESHGSGDFILPAFIKGERKTVAVGADIHRVTGGFPCGKILDDKLARNVFQRDLVDVHIGVSNNGMEENRFENLAVLSVDIAAEGNVHGCVVDHADVDRIPGGASQRDPPLTGHRLGDLDKLETRGFQHMRIDGVIAAVRRGDPDALKPAESVSVLNDDIDLLCTESRNREDGFRLTLIGKDHLIRVVILRFVDDRIETREGRGQIFRAGDGLNLPSCTVGVKADLILPVLGPPVDIQEDAVNRDALFLRNLQRFLRGGFGPVVQEP